MDTSTKNKKMKCSQSTRSSRNSLFFPSKIPPHHPRISQSSLRKKPPNRKSSITAPPWYCPGRKAAAIDWAGRYCHRHRPKWFLLVGLHETTELVEGLSTISYIFTRNGGREFEPPWASSILNPRFLVTNLKPPIPKYPQNHTEKR